MNFFSRAGLYLLCSLAIFAVTDWTRADPTPILPTIPNRNFPVTSYGALGDGRTPSTQGIQMAIDACEEFGGGHIIVPAGTYQLPGPIHLVSNIDLHLDQGAVLVFTRNFDAYPLMVTNYEGLRTVNRTSLILASRAKNMSITGAGVIEGNGDAWRQVRKSRMTNEQWDKLVKSGGVVDPATQMWWPSRAAMDGFNDLETLRHQPGEPNIPDYVKYGDLLRPDLVTFSDCQNVLLDGPTFRNSPCWNIHPFCCDEVVVRHITVDNPVYGANSDGIDIDSCRNVLVADSTFNAGDDDICLKSGRDEPGRRLGRPTENVTVTNCTIGTGHGGITIGSEMSGGVRNVRVSHCTLDETDVGIRIKTARGRGNVVEDVEISDLNMAHIQQGAIEINMFYALKNPPEFQPTDEGTPIFRNVHIKGIHCTSAKLALNIHGLKEMPIQNLTMEDMDITADQAGHITNAAKVSLKNVKIHAPSSVKIDNVTDLTTENVAGIGS